MQFLIIAYDGKAGGALERRMAARPAHMAGIERMKSEGKMLYGVAILDESDMMIGSVVVADFSSRDDLDAWLGTEPYVTGKVWEKIEVFPCRVPPVFI